MHWSLAVICFPGQLRTVEQARSLKERWNELARRHKAHKGHVKKLAARAAGKAEDSDEDSELEVELHKVGKEVEVEDSVEKAKRASFRTLKKARRLAGESGDDDDSDDDPDSEMVQARLLSTESTEKEEDPGMAEVLRASKLAEKTDADTRKQFLAEAARESQLLANMQSSDEDATDSSESESGPSQGRDFGMGYDD